MIGDFPDEGPHRTVRSLVCGLLQQAISGKMLETHERRRGQLFVESGPFAYMFENLVLSLGPLLAIDMGMGGAM